MVRCANRYKVNVLALQNLPVILVALGFALGEGFVYAFDTLGVQVAYCYEIRQPAGIVCHSCTPSAHTDCREAQPFAWCFLCGVR